MNLRAILSNVDEFVIRVQFTSRTRIEFYRSIALLLDNNVLLNEALIELYNVFSEDGKKKSDALAVVALECHRGMSNGLKLSEALKRWVPHQEATLIAAGEKSGALSQALKDAIRTIIYKQRIVSAVLGATLYPSFLYTLAGVLLWVISALLVPKMAKISDPETWEGVGQILYLVASATTSFGIYTLVGLVLLIIFIFLSLPRWTGDMRVFMDRWPIYTTYRVLHGSTFLLNVSVMIRAGIPLLDALLLLSKGGSPWLKERIDAAIYGTRQGGNLGVALDRAGHRFPEKRAVQFLKILASRDGFEDAINNFSMEWLEQCIKRVEASAALSLIISSAFMAGLMALVVLGTFDMQDALDRSVGSRAH
ncbi:type II secretion system F family protein [Pseudomonas sp. AB12(2023)]|uniref:type II secretion system F family protein n=1 Tax=Pseudomonas sp. AB12(2023) TaxID=3048597 RepID=UPI002B230223|nr:type II secretion system F family protein [Pseudomonas sp. AB12(2023)]MEB0222039.1 type II secretion system F family protein [Pseudomonas sp. AB12(2023)]